MINEKYKNEIIMGFVEACTKEVKNMNTNDSYWTHYWILGSTQEYNWALVLGWSEGYEPNEDEFTDNKGYHLCAKIGLQTKNSIMQEYDIDWNMPYDMETGEVLDTELSIDDPVEDVEYLLYMYEDQFEKYVEKGW